ncbi:MAG: SPOR domain-containing protein [Parasphingorhabdus sp.]|uniref:SPOR domain-containing protein n=1 Tax=Parasphingorhabdus sp. TaxID=2709688 RepID=UPI00300349C8
MKRDTILKLAASAMVISTTLTGCGPFGGGSVASSSAKPATVKDGAKYAKKAEKALRDGKTEDAIIYAERSVAGVGNDPETRALLGHSYMAAGRFQSAERSFLDAMELGKNDARTLLSLSMAQLAQGKANKALQLIENNRQYIPTADYGLALAMAGDTKTAIATLEQAIRNSDVSGRTRQNLGLAYALDGRWQEAKLMAMQDITPASVDKRVMQWAQMARPDAYEVRVASLLNVTPAANDPGQPVGLALNVTPAMPAVANANPDEDYSVEVASFDRNAPLPAVGPAPVSGSNVDFMAKANNVEVSHVDVPASKPAAKTLSAKTASISPEKAFIAEGPTAPDENAVVETTAAPVTTAAIQAISAVKPVMQKIAFTPRSRAVSNGNHLVQLGAFSSAESAKRAWGILSERNSDLKSFQYASSAVKVKGKTLYRLAAMGFGNEQSANAMCAGIKAKGGNCIVRNVDTVRPTQMASKAPRQIAAR